ncbi:putative late blight resistance protein homolog R1A-3 [Solanum verrucosum]|uniref:putative late blight resistance protein homolog R1A-3 n=1 Tax=Solanum verrucosum TaxID=315347 RepID=UPI0020D121B0|nr:putative late blight resistance protein homolog R1A-3 [Solanum verrucosum]
MAYTSVNYSVNHLIRLLSSRGLIFSKEGQIPMLKLELVFLRTFLWWTAKRCTENQNLELLLLQIEVVVRNAISHIQARDSDEWSFQVLHHTRLLKPEIEKTYIKIVKSSPPTPDTRVVVEFMNNLIDNLKDLLRYPDSSTFSPEEELRQLVTKLRFLRNLLSFVATRCTDHEKLKHLSNYAEAIAIEAACLPFMCSFDQKDGNSTSSIKDKLTELTRKINPITPDIRRIYVEVLEALSPLTTETDISDPDLASFIDTLQDCLTELKHNQPPWIRSFEALHHELTFLSSFTKDPPEQFIESDNSDDPKVDPIQLLLGEMRDWSTSSAHPFKHYTEHLTLKGQFTRIQDLAVKVGCTIFFFFNFNEMEEHKLAEEEATLVDLIEKIKHLKSEIGVPMLTLPEVNIIRTDDLGFIRNLIELINQQAGPLDCLKRRVQGIADELEFLSSFLKKCGERRHEHEKLRNLAGQIMTVAYRAEYVIDSLLVRDGTLFYHSFCIVDVVGEMKRIRREVMVFDEKMSNVIEPKVLNSTMPSRDMVSVAMSEELVGLEDEKERLRDQLINGSHALSAIPILGICGLGKTTLAMSLYHDELVVKHFDIRAAVSVSHVYDTEKLVLAVLHNINGYPDTSNGGDGDLLKVKKMIYLSLKGKRFLILIDDVRDTEAYVDLGNLFPNDFTGSRILLTTRSYQIASCAAHSTKIHNLRFLTEEESWKLLKKKIFHQQFCLPELEEAGKHMVKQCHGIPAMIVWMADIVARTRTEADWIQVGECNQIDEYLFSINEKEYSVIPDHLRPCFLYFGAFPLEEEIPVSKLIKLWAAEGFIQQTEAESSEAVAMDYLRYLVERGFVMACQRSSEGEVKRCKVHDRWHKFCLVKASHENFFQLMDLGGGVDPNDSNIPLSLACDHRRLFTSSNWWDSITLQVSGPFVRTLVLTGRRCDLSTLNISSLYQNLKLVRVLDLGRINVGNDFPVGLEKMTLLKYLEVRGEMTSIPSSIDSLRQLETFVTIGLRGAVAIPGSIWSLTNLRHLHIKGGTYSLGAPEKMLPNLRTMSTPLLRYGEDSEEILRRLVRLEKLKCIFLDSSRKKNLFPKLGILEHLQSLKLLYYGEVRKTCEFNFPSNLRRLTLSGFRLPWDQISIIGELPNLEMLKLLNKAFEGSLWEVKDDQFPCLKYLKLDTLDLEEWYMSEDALPELERLELKKCKKLRKIPLNIDNPQKYFMVDDKLKVIIRNR